MTKERLHEHGSEASFRLPQQRLSQADSMARIVERGHTISPLFGIPYFKVELISIDWLHCMDLGVTQIFLGSLFNLCMTKFSGSENENCTELWRRMQQYYKRTQCENQLQTLKPSMLKGKGHPKLRGKAGETRSLVAFGFEIAENVLTSGDEELAARAAAKQLAEMYRQLSRNVFDAVKLQNSCDLFSRQYVALHMHQAHLGGQRWPIKPKFHLMQELMYEARSSPSDAWTYRDEGWGGTMAKWSFRRGGKYSPKAMGLSLFERFTGQDLPQF